MVERARLNCAVEHRIDGAEPGEQLGAAVAAHRERPRVRTTRFDAFGPPHSLATRIASSHMSFERYMLTAESHSPASQ